MNRTKACGRLLRRREFLLGGAVLLAAGGCNHWPHTRDQGPVANLGQVPNNPTAPQLVEFLNSNSRRVQGFECRDLSLDVKSGSQLVGLSGSMAVQKPLDFRVVAKVVSNTEVDMGSNKDEFWYWIKRAEPTPYVFHCSYDDFNRGNVRYMPFPFQPDWIMATMGVAEYDPNKNYELKRNGRMLELVENATSPQGQRVRKVTVINSDRVSNGQPQVVAHRLEDANGKEICSARMQQVQVDRATGAVLPKRIHMIWAQDKSELKVEMPTVIVGVTDPGRAASLYSRATLNNLPSFDLSRGPDAASNVQRVRGQMP